MPRFDYVFCLLVLSYVVVYIWQLMTLMKLCKLMKRIDIIVKRAGL